MMNLPLANQANGRSEGRICCLPQANSLHEEIMVVPGGGGREGRSRHERSISYLSVDSNASNLDTSVPDECRALQPDGPRLPLHDSSGTKRVVRGRFALENLTLSHRPRCGRSGSRPFGPRGNPPRFRCRLCQGVQWHRRTPVPLTLVRVMEHDLHWAHSRRAYHDRSKGAIRLALAWLSHGLMLDLSDRLMPVNLSFPGRSLEPADGIQP